jgi:DNA modification methylase
MNTVQLHHGDCLDLLKSLPDGSVDAVVTDPPYGYAYESNYVAPTTTAPWMNKSIAGDADTSLRDAVLAMFPIRPWACFGSLKRPAPTGTRGTLVWDKGPASGMGDLSFPWKGSFELIFIGGRGWAGRRDEGVLKGFNVVTRKSMGRVHPNEKPVSLLMHMIEKLPEGCTVLDPFMGSGTTGVACVNTGRNFIGVEIDRGYYEIAQRRIAEAQAKRAEQLIPA